MTLRSARSLLVVLAIAACGGAPVEAGGAHDEASTAAIATAHAWSVYDGETLVLSVTDTPGPLLSTALPPPGLAPPSHPFLSGTAHSAAHEGRLRAVLDRSRNLSSFLDGLRAEGFRVEPRP